MADEQWTTANAPIWARILMVLGFFWMVGWMGGSSDKSSKESKPSQVSYRRVDGNSNNTSVRSKPGRVSYQRSSYRSSNLSSSVGVLHGTDKGSDWLKASYSAKMTLCRSFAHDLADTPELSHLSHNANWIYGYLESAYSGPSPLLSASIAETVVLGVVGDHAWNP